MHKRLIPKVNQFTYGVYYLVLPISDIDNLSLLPPFLTFKKKDHGARNGEDLKLWIYSILRENKISCDGEIMLVCMPRIFGYVFNPVSFWFCLDKQGKLKAVLSEVNNTFGETHSYLCFNSDKSEIKPDDIFDSEKLFHVSPFLSREGSYKFRFDYREDKIGIWIDYYNKQSEKTLLTTLAGKVTPLTKKNLVKHFFKYPLVTVKVISLIHYQAFKLFAKGIKYICKPKQKDVRTSAGQNKNLKLRKSNVEEIRA